MRVFLTGATGYIGGAVLSALRRHGHEVVALVRTPKKADALRASNAMAVLGDMTSPDGWIAAAAQCDAIIHTAQIRLEKRLGNSWVRKAKNADAIAIRGLQSAAVNGGRCKTFIYTSGVSVFGDHGSRPINEDAIGKPGAIGRYHLAGERLALEGATPDLATIVLRPGIPYSTEGNFAEYFLAPAATGTFSLVGDGDNYFPGQHLDDLAEAYALTLERRPAGEVLAVVDDEPMRMREIARLLLDQFGGGKLRPAPPWLVGLIAGRPLAQMMSESYRVDNARAKAALRWQPRYPSLREALPSIVSKFQEIARGRSN